LTSEKQKGHQIFVVCPLVEESELTEAESATERFEQIQKELPDFRCGLLHGKMKQNDKDEVMERFRAHELDLLVSTTVIEVGVDVPNATVMVVENAERFGLSTLHQLRGRIGRGTQRSYCILISGADSERARERLDTMCRTDDGFEIARTDLKLRGPGDFFGERQSGDLRFKVASSADMPLVEQTRAAVDVILENGLLEREDYAALRDATEKLWQDNLRNNTLN
ncbi:MAG: DNA helicase RecG, partial [Clostridia bacterium]|nr:DNA helicase RecG [Clostridia bacterium]